MTRPPGHYLELVRKHNFPPQFTPRCVWVSSAQARQSASEARMRIAEAGRETWGGKGDGRLFGEAAAEKVRIK